MVTVKNKRSLYSSFRLAFFCSDDHSLHYYLDVVNEVAASQKRPVNSDPLFPPIISVQYGYAKCSPTHSFYMIYLQQNSLKV
jgi:hypothetical protein